MSLNLLSFLTFGAVASVVAGIYSIVSDVYLRDRERVTQRLDEEFRKKQRIRVQQSPLFKNLGQLVADTAANRDVAPGIRQRFESMIEQSGIDITLKKLLIISAGLSISLASPPLLFRKGFLIAGLLALTGFAAPLLYVNHKRKARLEKLLSQLPDTFDLMARVIRAGQTMSQALQAVADEFPQPISSEFGYCFEQQNLGLSSEIAMRDLARRTGLLDIRIFVMAVLVQQQTGGNLAELLDKLSVIIRTRYKIRGQVKSLTAEGRMQAAVLLGLPPALFVMMLVMNKSYASTLLEYPSLIGGTVICEGIGAIWIRKIVNFDF
jgi:tight adherence protein B